MRLRGVFVPSLFGLLGAPLSGCRPERRVREPAAVAETGCAAVGLTSALQVRIAGVPTTEAVFVEATARGRLPAGVGGADSTHVAGACTGAECARGVWFQQFAPDTLDLLVRTRAGAVRRRIAPAYVTPPGGTALCPVARTGTLTVPFAG